MKFAIAAANMHIVAAENHWIQADISLKTQFSRAAVCMQKMG